MKIFLVGGSGYVGGSVGAALARQGDEIIGLSRSEQSDAALRSFGATPVRGEVGDPATIDHAASADCVVWAPSFAPAELPVLESVMAALAGQGGALIYTSGTAVVAELTMGEAGERIFAEDTPFTPPRFLEVRVAAEDIVRAGAEKGVRAMIVRPPLVYGHGASTQIPALFESGRRSGAIRYVGRGLNRWSYIHIDDLAELYVAALARGVSGAIYHAVAGEADFRSMAEAVAEVAGVPAASWPIEEAEAESGYGKFVSRIVLGSSSRTTSDLTERALGWRPTRRDILEDIRNGSYRQAFSKTAG